MDNWKEYVADNTDKRKTAFVIGTGPSLRNIDVSLLKDHTTITFNRAYIAFEEWGFDPTYYLAIDGNDIRSIYKDINNLILNSDIKNFFFADITNNEQYTHKDSYQDGDIVSSNQMFVDSKKVFYLWPDYVSMINPTRALKTRHNLFSSKYGTYKPQKMSFFPAFINEQWARPGGGANAGFVGIKVLVALGYTRIVFVGCDCKYRDDQESNKDITVKEDDNEYASHDNTDVNHFSPNYFGKGIHFGKPNEQDILKIWSRGADRFKQAGIQVISCTEDSKANEWYDYIPFEDFIKTI